MIVQPANQFEQRSQIGRRLQAASHLGTKIGVHRPGGNGLPSFGTLKIEILHTPTTEFERIIDRARAGLAETLLEARVLRDVARETADMKRLSTLWGDIWELDELAAILQTFIDTLGQSLRIEFIPLDECINNGVNNSVNYRCSTTGTVLNM